MLFSFYSLILCEETEKVPRSFADLHTSVPLCGFSWIQASCCLSFSQTKSSLSVAVVSKLSSFYFNVFLVILNHDEFCVGRWTQSLVMK